ncbi:MAG TPA: glycosyltransferase family 2 protein, partial [Bacillota bacterium]|nr:glycosyltransferase family 2 protein [Bacillota bacterium]
MIPVLNQVHYTQGCLTCLAADIAAGVSVVVVDNGSTDSTAEFLAGQPQITVIRNPQNRGCAAAWNQGVQATQAEWVVVLNNDVLLPRNWLTALIDFAEKEQADVVSPAVREGELNYDLEAYAREFIERMQTLQRSGAAHGICFLVRRRVFETIGLFDENFRIGQFEDADFFLRAQRAGFRLTTTGAVFIHHFGSITQKALKQERTPRPYEAENRAYFRKKWRLGWWRRRSQRLMTSLQGAWWRRREQRHGGHTLHEKWVEGKLVY